MGHGQVRKSGGAGFCRTVPKMLSRRRRQALRPLCFRRRGPPSLPPTLQAEGEFLKFMTKILGSGRKFGEIEAKKRFVGGLTANPQTKQKQ